MLKVLCLRHCLPSALGVGTRATLTIPAHGSGRAGPWLPGSSIITLLLGPLLSLQLEVYEYSPTPLLDFHLGRAVCTHTTTAQPTAHSHTLDPPQCPPDRPRCHGAMGILDLDLPPERLGQPLIPLLSAFSWLQSLFLPSFPKYLLNTIHSGHFPRLESLFVVAGTPLCPLPSYHRR